MRQGGILSPRLFSWCVNHLKENLISCNTSCHFNSICIHHVMYADDICSLAPTASAMQHLLDVCYDYGVEHDIASNLFHSVGDAK